MLGGKLPLASKMVREAEAEEEAVTEPPLPAVRSGDRAGAGAGWFLWK